MQVAVKDSTKDGSPCHPPNSIRRSIERDRQFEEITSCLDGGQRAGFRFGHGFAVGAGGGQTDLLPGFQLLSQFPRFLK